MPAFDENKKYRPKEDDTFFDDGREIELLHFVYNKNNLNELRGSPQHVLDAIDEYARTRKYLMNIGEAKGKIVSDLITEVKPRTMVELGGYVGYSTILFGDAFRKAGGTTYYSLERNPEFAAVIASLVDLAGLKDVVNVVVGPSSDSICRLVQTGILQRMDLLFLDHFKPAYITDLKLCEELGLVRPGTVLAADNVITPGNPPYLAYVKSSVSEKRVVAKQDTGANDVRTQFSDRAFNQYKRREDQSNLENVATGVPDLVYDTKTIRSYEPSGEPVGITHYHLKIRD